MDALKSFYPVDHSAILYLSQMEPNHTNIYRFTITLAEPVCPETLQKAADRVYTRFPTIFAGFHPGFLDYTVVPAQSAPQVVPDPGLLKTMTRDEIRQCAYRIYYRGNQVSIEAFHALTDGFGAIASFRTLMAEYLYLRCGVDSPERRQMLENGEPDWDAELRDAYLDYDSETPSRPPNRAACQLTGGDRDWTVKAVTRTFSTARLLAASRSHGVSMTAMLSALMAEAILELQKGGCRPGLEKPARIMVPIDLRRQFPSRTLRNFILYALPTMEPEEASLPRGERFLRFHSQLQAQTAREPLAAQLASNVRLQRLWLYRMLPRVVKCGLMKLAYGFFGECNSSITLTNLGGVALSDELKQHIRALDVFLTPRRLCPYNCGLISLGDVTSITVTHFCTHGELAESFFQKLHGILQDQLAQTD